MYLELDLHLKALVNSAVVNAALGQLPLANVALPPQKVFYASCMQKVGPPSRERVLGSGGE